jgi:dTDP-glucose 4,6-dehydratase
MNSLSTYQHVLVTGGAGFIGSWFVRYLLSQYPNVHITNLDALFYAGNLQNLADVEANPALKARYQFVHGDIRDAALVSRLLNEPNVFGQKIDALVNIAAQTHVDRSITGPSIFVETNVLGTQTLLEAARLAKIAKFVQVSTDEVYGSLGETGAFSETTPIDPSSPYSASKASADLLALSYFRTYGMNVCVTRCSNNYGPYQYPEKLIPFFMMKALRDEPLPVYGDGLNVRDWIYVEDHNAAVDAVLQAGRAGEVYNIGTDNEHTNLAITHSILKFLNKPQTLITYVQDRLGHDRRYAIDAAKIQSELSWTPQQDFETGLAKTLAWYQNNPEWLAHVLKRQAELEPAQPVLSVSGV